MKILKYKILTNEENNLKILVISDLHIFKNKDITKLKKIINYLKQNKYDCFLKILLLQII